MERYLLVALGGALGSLLRYGLGAWVQGLTGPGFPYSTLFVNALGSFLIGVVVRLSLEGALSGEARLFLAVGLLGGFTTFSTFSYETLALLQEGEVVQALFYVGASLALGLFLVLLGYRLGGALVA
ncbi:MAG: fluoride efflux transporter CrcB [Thermus sp.]|uniref:fluoride efflux transporter CrcB n=1 Tax=Thermus sp. TaxID=275 RepID=UPI0025F821DF|nr:fluoride efflux transporter CrcB [Thermus sp.]MCS6868801.1 fluoride efflux transporter CrcB [Thermus sp.]MCS7219426.1 fluoride efflux transporter CrcB [Thermus sp.]MCX7850711.1 fluoride efflux transporter CrcB [Thermus sp.]MDW8016519.1 fluoride efflux transporter CrcB [Thermus sp.]MDW8357522.1 fluoride efflux transporter CrcB [Thermus sp.]